MKRRLSISDVTSLSGAQQDSLRQIWTPERYDIAVSRFCVNAEKDEYKWLEFAIGDISVTKSGEVLLKDLRLTDGYAKILDSEARGGEDFELKEPTSFYKSACLPLLTFGQMTAMLHMLDKSNYHFYLLAGNKKFSCEIGDFNSKLKANLLKKHEKHDEIVDVLWSTFRTIL